MTGDGVGSKWLREQVHRRTDPDERSVQREALTHRLFGAPDTDAAEDKLDDGPDAT